jgi:hypothetical protein
MFVNCAKAWTRLVLAYHRITGRPQVTFDRDAVPVRTAKDRANR